MANIYFCGFQGSGKTTCGKELANKMGRDFVDVDDLILERANPQETIREFHARVRDEKFRKIEEEIVLKLVKERNLVVALGGGSMKYESVQKALYKSGSIIYLCLRYEKLVEILQEKISSGIIPTYLNLEKPLESFHSIFLERNPIFLHYASQIVHVENLSIEEIVEKVLVNGLK